MNIRSFLKEELKARQDSAVALKDVAKSLLTQNIKNTGRDQYYRTLVLRPILDDLEAIYKELRHYTGKWPIVYSEDQITKYPYLEGTTDDMCNPYYRTSLVQSKQSNGLDPIFSEPTRTGAPSIARDRNWIIAYQIAKTALLTYPDHSGENILNPVWIPSETAPELLRTALNDFKSDFQTLVTEVYKNDPTTISNGNALIVLIDAIFPLLPPPPVSPNQTPPAGGALASAMSTLVAGIDQFVLDTSGRIGSLQSMATEQEQAAFEVIKLRIHAMNGTYSATKNSSMTLSTIKSALTDQVQASQTLSRLITKIPGL